MYTLPRNSGGHTLSFFFASFRRSKSALCHLLCEATCSLRTDKRLGNVTSVVDNSKIVSSQQLDLGDRIMHIIHIFWGSCIFHVSNIIRMRTEKENGEWKMENGEVISKTRALCDQVSKRLKTIKPLGLRPCGFKCFSRLETRWNTRTRFWNLTSTMSKEIPRHLHRMAWSSLAMNFATSQWNLAWNSQLGFKVHDLIDNYVMKFPST